jgi:peptidoglycan/LPS O-acetylase OafA/YrhL
MTLQKSLFLDFTRIVAALVVLYGHAVLEFYGGVDESNPFLITNMRHFAVVLFFVLSGYVIAFSTNVNNRGAKKYIVARLSRLYSMVLPALVVSFLIECMINHFTYNSFHLEFQSLLRYPIAVLFMNEFWMFSSAPRVNTALWSVSFEFFFYLIFGVYFYTREKVKKVIYTSVACLFAGPKILLMSPIWVAGYLAYKYNDKVVKFKNWFLYFCFLSVP